MAPSILELRDQPQIWSTQPKLEPESLPLCRLLVQGSELPYTCVVLS